MIPSHTSFWLLTHLSLALKKESGVWRPGQWLMRNSDAFYKIFNKESISFSGWRKVERICVPRYNCRHHQWQVFNECLLYIEPCVISVAVVLKWESFCLPPLSRGHFSTSGDIFNCHSVRWEGRTLLVPSGWRTGILLNIYNIKAVLLSKELSSPKCQQFWGWETLVCGYKDIEPGPSRHGTAWGQKEMGMEYGWDESWNREGSAKSWLITTHSFS